MQTTRFFRTILILMTIVLLASLFGCARGQADPEQADAIRKMLDRQVEDWNKHDLDGFAAGYWHSQNLIFQSGTSRTEGWDGMRERYRKNYQSDGKEMGHLEFKDIEIELLGPDSAYARGHWQLTMSDGKQPGGLFTLILRKFPEGWRIVHDHTS